MTRRGMVIAGAVLLALGASPILAWPLAEGMFARSVENRLRQETGQDWRIRGGTGLSFRPTPQVTFNDVSVGDPSARTGMSATIKRVRLSDLWMLISGGASVNAVAEGISLRAPVSAASTGLELDGISAIRAELSGTKLDLGEADRVVVASAELADLGLTFANGSANTSIKVKLALAEHDVSLIGELDRSAPGEPLTGPIRIAIAHRNPATEPGKGQRYRLEASARARVLPTSVAFDALAGGIDGEPFSGTLSISLGSKPKVVGDLALEALTLKGEGAPPRSEKAAGLVVTVPTDAVPLPAWFEGFDASGVLQVARLTLGGVPLNAVELTAEVRQSGLDLGLVRATAFGGAVRGRYVLVPEPDASGRHQLSLSASGVRAASVLTELAGARGIDGAATLRADLQATGDTPGSLRRSLAGTAELSVQDGQLNGLDLAGTVGMLPKIIHGVPQIGALATRLDSLTANFSVADGRALTNDLDLRTSLLGASGIGSIDLFARTLDIYMKPTVASASPAGGNRSRIDVPIRIAGPWSNPSISADMSGLAKDPGSAIQTLQDLGAGLLGADSGKRGKTLRESLDENLGENLGGLLDGLLPRQDAPPLERRRP